MAALGVLDRRGPQPVCLGNCLDFGARKSLPRGCGGQESRGPVVGAVPPPSRVAAESWEQPSLATFNLSCYCCTLTPTIQ